MNFNLFDREVNSSYDAKIYTELTEKIKSSVSDIVKKEFSK